MCSSDLNWTTTPSAQINLSDASYKYRAQVADAAGNTATSNVIAVTVDTTAPNAPSITSVTDDVGTITGALTTGGRTDDTNLTVKVSLTSTNAVAGDTIQLYNGGTALGTAYTLLAGDITAGYADVATGALSNGTSVPLETPPIWYRLGLAANAAGCFNRKS